VFGPVLGSGISEGKPVCSRYPRFTGGTNGTKHGDFTVTQFGIPEQQNAAVSSRVLKK
jgi:hypothetical protein